MQKYSGETGRILMKQFYNYKCRILTSHNCFLINMFLFPQKGKKCKNTWRQGEPIRFEYDGCSSVKQYRPKYCSTCKRKRCCYPDKTKTNAMEWTCEDGKNAVHDFMWIKGCVCKDKCP